MKNLKKLGILFLLIHCAIQNNGQIVNWQNLKPENKHILNANVGIEYGFIYGIGYSYKPNINKKIVLNLEYSFPSGSNLIDDFKTKIGGQVRLHKINNIQLSLNAYGICRRFENDFVRLINFGSDFSTVIGYYKPKWFIAAEIGFDKAIVTHFKHSQIYRDNYPDVVDGWYEPSTGGNVHYGIQTCFSFKTIDCYIKLGELIQQDFKTKPNLPFYSQLGVNYKFIKTRK
jgi:hypothetical protein